MWVSPLLKETLTKHRVPNGNTAISKISWFLLFLRDLFRVLHLSPSPTPLTYSQKLTWLQRYQQTIQVFFPLKMYLCPHRFMEEVSLLLPVQDTLLHKMPLLSSQAYCFIIYLHILFLQLSLSPGSFLWTKKKVKSPWPILPTLASTLPFLYSSQLLKREPPGMSSSPTFYLDSTISGNLDSSPFTTLKQLLPNDFQVA